MSDEMWFVFYVMSLLATVGVVTIYQGILSFIVKEKHDE